MRRPATTWMMLLVAALLCNLVARPQVATAAIDSGAYADVQVVPRVLAAIQFVTAPLPSGKVPLPALSGHDFGINQPVNAGDFLRMLTAVGNFADAPDFWPQYWQATEKSISPEIKALAGFQAGHPSAPLLRAAAEDDVLNAPLRRLLGAMDPTSQVTREQALLWTALWLQVTDSAAWIDQAADQRIPDARLMLRAQALMARIGLPAETPLPGSTLSRVDAAETGYTLWQLRHQHLQPVRPPVILLHGAGQGPDFWSQLPPGIAGVPTIHEVLIQDGYRDQQTLFMPFYNSTWGVNDGLRVLKQTIREAQGKVAVVGHSLGGVIGRLYISQPHKAENVHTLITVASPHQGFTRWRDPLPGLSGVATDLLVPTVQQVKIGGTVTRYLAAAPLPRSVRVIAVAGAPAVAGQLPRSIGDRMDTVVKTMYSFPSTMAPEFTGIAGDGQQSTLLRSSPGPIAGRFYGWARGARGEIQWVIAENQNSVQAQHEPVMFHPFTAKLLRFYLRYPYVRVPDSSSLGTAQLIPAPLATGGGITPDRILAAARRLSKLGLLRGPILATGTNDLKLSATMTRAELAALIDNGFGSSGQIATVTENPDAAVTVGEALTTLMKALGVANLLPPPHVLQTALAAGVFDPEDQLVFSGLLSTPATRGFIYAVVDRGFYGTRLSNGKTVYTTFADTVPPDLSVAPSQPLSAAVEYSVHGWTSPDTASVRVPGLSRAADLRADGSWSILVPLAPGANTITVTATDLAGNATEATVTIVRDRATEPPPLSVPGLYALGLRALEKGDYQKAIAPLSEAIKLNPQHAAAYCARGVADLQIGDPNAAVADLTRSIALAPAEPCGYDWRGYVYLSQGKFNLAFADYQQATVLDPDSFVLRYRRGLVYRGLGENAKALADFQRAVQMSGGVWREAALRQIQDLAADAGH